MKTEHVFAFLIAAVAIAGIYAMNIDSACIETAKPAPQAAQKMDKVPDLTIGSVMELEGKLYSVDGMQYGKRSRYQEGKEVEIQTLYLSLEREK